MNIRLLAAFFSLSLFSCNISARDQGWVQADSSELKVRANSFLDSKTTSADWSRLVSGGMDPFGKGNRYFKMLISNKKSGKDVVISMIPASFLAISPNSEFIVLLSKAFPTDGIVIVSGEGEILYRRFSVCFPEGCPVISHDSSPWFHDVDVGITFGSPLEGRECRITVKENADDPRSGEFTVDLCDAK
jgi:hypothetical protein